MKKDYIIHPEAREEIQAIDRYLSDHAPRRHDIFPASLEKAINRARKRPKGGRPTFHNCRLFEVPRLPYRVIYKELPDALWIIAVAHTARRPGYWMDRLNDDS